MNLARHYLGDWEVDISNGDSTHSRFKFPFIKTNFFLHLLLCRHVQHNWESKVTEPWTTSQHFLLCCSQVDESYFSIFNMWHFKKRLYCLWIIISRFKYIIEIFANISKIYLFCKNVSSGANCVGLKISIQKVQHWW